MSRTIPLTEIVSVIVGVAIVTVLLGMALGQPALIAYVDSGSMEPTIDAGEGFFVVPDVLAPSYEEGDVVVFESPEDGRLTTHRIVSETDDGYITRGDANPFTDQDDGSPPVTDEHIVAKAVQVNGWLPTVPHVETVVTSITGVSTAIMGVVAAIVGIGTLPTLSAVGTFLFFLGVIVFWLSVTVGDRQLPRRSYARSYAPANSLNATRAVAVVLVVILIPANAVMLVPSGGTTITVDGQDIAAEPGVQPGDTITSTITARNDGLIAQYIAIETDTEEVTLSRSELELAVGDSAELTAETTAPDYHETSVATITQYRYLYVLPGPVISWLHDIHPALAWLVINAVIALGVAGIAFGYLGFGRVRFRERTRSTRNLK